MDADTILHELTHADGLPRAALAAASARRAEMVPVFLKEIDDYLAASAADRAKPRPLFFIFHLLGDWGEKSAYRPLSRLLRRPDHELDAVFGDGLVETAHRVMAAVFDGDPEPLFDIALEPEAEEFVRSRMCETIAMVAVRGELDRDVATRFFRDGFTNLEPQAECFVWNGWQSGIAMLGLSDLAPLVKQAFDRGFIDSGWLGFDDFEQDLRRGIERAGGPEWRGNREYTLFGDTTEELSTWYCFIDKYKEDEERRRRRAEEERADEEPWLGAGPSEPYVNPFRGIGRNDPCPCGSGKKFKKCCLR